MVLINSMKEVTAVEQGFNIIASGGRRIGSEIQGRTVEKIELRAKSFVEEREYENRRVLLYAT